MRTLNLKPNHKAIKAYYNEINDLFALGVSHEGAVSPAFATLLRHCASQLGWKLIEKQYLRRNMHTIFVDGVLKDEFNVPHGYWEAKDTSDDLEIEVKKKLDVCYPNDNILFQAPNHAIIWQDAKEVYNEDISEPQKLIECLGIFFEYQPPAFQQWQEAIEQFKQRVPEIATGLLQLIREQRQKNKAFMERFDDFTRLCREALNPNISTEAVEEMLIQHVLTERVFRKVFSTSDFRERNIIAHEIEKVISALTSHAFSRDDFMKSLDRFYIAIETTASTIDDFSQKQGFLNTIYEKFFQGFSVKVADTHGIVYTPQAIVNFMVNSVEDILQKNYRRSLSDEGVHIIDPFVGTGNFIIHIMRKIKRAQLPYKYHNELHCNEVLLLPYYISSMNIEHEYYQLVSEYEPFKGICLVDTFDIGTSEQKQFSFLTQENKVRIEHQRNSPIFVVIANPPYNAGQVNENDNNKNRKYPEIDRRVSQSYAKDSRATLLRKLNDPYVKAIRWATDRIQNEGIVAFVTNSSFVTGVTFDGMRKHLAQDFDTIYILDLGGNVRRNPSLSGTTHNVFGIQVGVSISILVKRKDTPLPKQAKIYYARVDEFWRKEQKYDFLDEKRSYNNIEWKEIKPDNSYTWLTEGLQNQFETFIPIGTKEGKSSTRAEIQAIFKTYSLGVATNRDEWVYDFQEDKLEGKVNELIHNYNFEVLRLSQESGFVDIDNFVNNDPHRIKWTDRLKKALQQSVTLTCDLLKVRHSMYRPFVKQFLYFDHLLNQRRYRQHLIFPTSDSESENRVICVSGVGSSKPFQAFTTNVVPCLDMLEKTQCFPIYIYDEDGINRQENITDWALAQFQVHYEDAYITKLDISHYVYAVLHHPVYRDKYSANLKRELPHIPFTPSFWGFAKAGAKLAEMHVNYEQQPEYQLEWLENKDALLNWRVKKMKLSRDKTRLIYNDFLSLSNIPLAVFEYRFGNRSALEWVIDQYQVKTDKRSGITSEPNRPDSPEYIVQLAGKVVTVSLETMKIVKSLPNLE
jgi:predicted helicase